MVQEFLLQFEKGWTRMNGKLFRGPSQLICSTAFLAVFLLATAACGTSNSPEDAEPSMERGCDLHWWNCRLGQQRGTRPLPVSSQPPRQLLGQNPPLPEEHLEEPVQPTASRPGSETVAQDASSSADASVPVPSASPHPTRRPVQLRRPARREGPRSADRVLPGHQRRQLETQPAVAQRRTLGPVAGGHN